MRVSCQLLKMNGNATTLNYKLKIKAVP